MMIGTRPSRVIFDASATQAAVIVYIFFFGYLCVLKCTVGVYDIDRYLGYSYKASFEGD